METQVTFKASSFLLDSAANLCDQLEPTAKSTFSEKSQLRRFLLKWLDLAHKCDHTFINVYIEALINLVPRVRKAKQDVAFTPASAVSLFVTLLFFMCVSMCAGLLSMFC